MEQINDFFRSCVETNPVAEGVVGPAFRFAQVMRFAFVTL